MLNDVIMKIAWAGKFLTLSILSAPKYCETIEDMALLVCPNTHISIDKNVVTIPTAARDSVAFIEIFPTTAASVRDKIGSDTPEIKAGMANRLIFFKLISVLKILIHSSRREIHFALENRFLLNAYSREFRKTFDFFYS